MQSLSLNIGAIQIIVHKKEEGKFDFFNESRSHDGFVLFTDGEGTFTDPIGHISRVGAGDMVLVRKGDKYHFVFDHGCSYYTSAFDFISCDGGEALPYVVHATDYIAKSISSAAKIWEARRYESEVQCRSILLDTYRRLYCEKHYAGDTGAAGIARRATDYIHASFKESFSTEDVAKVCCCSESYLRSVFSKFNGMSILEYKERLRIEAAKEMLKSDIFKIREIAESLGYCDVYYFSKCFTASVGIPPFKYRSITKFK